MTGTGNAAGGIGGALAKIKLLRRTASIANGIIGTVIESEEDTSDDEEGQLAIISYHIIFKSSNVM
jgi:hypothetical protein